MTRRGPHVTAVTPLAERTRREAAEGHTSNLVHTADNVQVQGLNLRLSSDFLKLYFPFTHM